MKTTTFKELICAGNQYGIDRIVIPRIQRAYAQGRDDSHATATRERFLSAIHKGLIGHGLTLDFIYGNIQDRKLIPLDGQQRLTTLWLLHWYAAKKEGIKENYLSSFSYETRYSARDFTAKLITFDPFPLETSLSAEIKNQGWFPMEWWNDPTVRGMLRMLDEIHNRFASIELLWNKLDNISFYFLNIEEMKLTDDIYIKMNSRGKPLTAFEHFKAEFLNGVRSVDQNASKRIGIKIDGKWADLLWEYRDENNLIDNAFLRLFRVISRIVLYRLLRSSATEINFTNDFDILEKLYKKEIENIKFLEKTLDCMADVASNCSSLNSRENIFKSYLSEKRYEQGKVVKPQQISDADILGGIATAENLKNSTYWVTILYSFLLYFMHRDNLKDSDFRRRLRVVVNLLKNSVNEVVDNPKSASGNRMPAVLKQVESIVLEGKIENLDANFNSAQLEEERQKLLFTQQNPKSSEALFELEDFYLLEGRVDVVGHENTKLYRRFIKLFTRCKRDTIDRAMLSVCDYSQRVNSWCIQLGSSDPEYDNKSWYALFHPSTQIDDYKKTKESLQTILKLKAQLDDSCLEHVINKFLQKCRDREEYDWRYYYITYSYFRPGKYGKYVIDDDSRYSLVALVTSSRESSNSFPCMLKSLLGESQYIKKKNFDNRSVSYYKGYLTCEKDAFVSYAITGDVRKRFPIPQNENGIDTVDRIDYYKKNNRNKKMWSD